MSQLLKEFAVHSQSRECLKSKLYIEMTKVAKAHLVTVARLKNKMPKAMFDELTEQIKKNEIQYSILVTIWQKISGRNNSKKDNVFIQELIRIYNDSFYDEVGLKKLTYLQFDDYNLTHYQTELQQHHKKYMARLYKDYEKFLSKLDYREHLVGKKEDSYKENYICGVYTIGTYFGLQRKKTMNILAANLNSHCEVSLVSLETVKEMCKQKWILTNDKIDCESCNILMLVDALLLIPTLINVNHHADSDLLTSLYLSKKELRDLIMFTNLLKADAVNHASPLLQVKKYEVLQLYANQFDKHAYKEIELTNRILVVGTMSSGKSTFLNSLIGQDLFPSKNEACTAKIFEYAFSDSSHYTVSKTNTDIKESFETLTKEKLEQLNEAVDQGSLFISGPSKSAVSINKKLVLIDTPGPNNSMDRSHRDIMKQAMSDDYDKILYILNATQIGTTDDMQLIQTVKELVLKNVNVPIYFIVNKVDMFDNDSNESIQTLQKNVEEYLLAQGFENPTIIFVSALAAKLVQNEANNQTMSRKERMQLRVFNDIMLEPEYNLAQYALNCNEPIVNQIHFNDTLTENQKKLCIHSGIPELLKYL